MEIYVAVPKDLNSVKNKILFNLTKRQLIGFSLGSMVGVPIFLVTRSFLGNSLSLLVMMACMFPFFLVAMYEKNHQTLEKMIWNFIKVRYLNSCYRPYQTRNLYRLLEKEKKYEKEVDSIVNKTKTKAYTERKKENRRNSTKNQ